MSNRYRVKASAKNDVQTVFSRKAKQKETVLMPSVKRNEIERFAIMDVQKSSPDAYEISRCFEQDARRYARCFENGVAE